MNQLFINILAPVFEFLDKRWRRQAVWICTGPLIIGLITRNIILGILLLIPATIIYIIWITLGIRILTEKRSRSLLMDTLLAKSGLEDTSMIQGFTENEKLLGFFTKAGFQVKQSEDTSVYHGIQAFFRRFSLVTRFQVTLVEINGKKYVRKRYTPYDYKFFQALRNNLILDGLDIVPRLKYTNLHERCTWTEYVDGPSLDYLSLNNLISPTEKSEYSKLLINFKETFHKLMLCNLDLHRGNIIIRTHDNRAMQVDIDEARHYPAGGLLYRMYCIRDHKRVARQVNLLTGNNTEKTKG
jgi:hypothetical protein